MTNNSELNLSAINRSLKQYAEFFHGVADTSDHVSRPPLVMPDVGRTNGIIKDIDSRLTHADNVSMNGGAYESREDGRSLSIDEREHMAETQMYDVVVIGGYAFVDDAESDHYTVNYAEPEGYGEENHKLAANQTKSEVESGSWTWPTETGYGAHFAIIAAPAGVDASRWGETEGDQWWNNLIPSEDICARSLDSNTSDIEGGITLTLEIGVIESE